MRSSPPAIGPHACLSRPWYCRRHEISQYTLGLQGAGLLDQSLLLISLWVKRGGPDQLEEGQCRTSMLQEQIWLDKCRCRWMSRTRPGLVITELETIVILLALLELLGLLPRGRVCCRRRPQHPVVFHYAIKPDDKGGGALAAHIGRLHSLEAVSRLTNSGPSMFPSQAG